MQQGVGEADLTCSTCEKCDESRRWYLSAVASPPISVLRMSVRHGGGGVRCAVVRIEFNSNARASARAQEFSRSRLTLTLMLVKFFVRKGWFGEEGK